MKFEQTPKFDHKTYIDVFVAIFQAIFIFEVLWLKLKRGSYQR